MADTLMADSKENIPMHLFVRLAMVAAFALTMAFHGLAQRAMAADRLVQKQSRYSVSETLDRLTNILKAKGITIFARIDHAAGAQKVDLKLRPTQLLIFGNPKMGTPLMQADPHIGLSLPLKVLAFRDRDGKVWLSYRQPSDLQAAYDLAAQGRIFAKMRDALDRLTDKAIH